MSRTPARADAGSILPLLLGCSAVAIGLVLLCIAATGIGTTRMTLYSMADAAAAAAAQSFALDSASSSPTAGLGVDSARTTVDELIAETPGGDDVRVVAVGVDANGTVSVSLATEWSSGLSVFGTALEAPVAVSVDARAVVR
ncbi:hypothetical protein HQQ80_14655 [Microbacteriaceae bacterium VKM Ac-2855]|nr:hypothetical protein [Microbacteriaceae bacterium VKM Ac-2855]